MSRLARIGTSLGITPGAAGKGNHLLRRRLLLLAVLAAGGAAVLCFVAGQRAGQSPNRQPAPPDGGKGLLSGPGGESVDADVRLLVKGMNQFAFDIYKKIAEGEKGNVFISPFCAYSALAMTYGGARGKTAEEMEKALRFPAELLKDDGKRLHAAMGRLTRDLDAEKTADGKPVGYVLSAGNALWGQRGYPFRAEFLRLTREAYGADVREADFLGESGRADAMGRMDAWASEKTRGKIDKIAGPGFVDGSTRLVLLSAIYFKGDWARAFDPGNTRDMPFHLSDGKAVDARMMTQEAAFPYLQGPSYKAVAMPYAGGRLSMEIYLPEEGLGAEDVADAVGTSIDGGAGSSSWKAQLLSLRIPRFNFKTDVDLQLPLAGMGMGAAFRREEADFTGMADPAETEEKLYIARACQKAVIDVNEKGSEAAAVTVIVMAAFTCGPTEIPFHADRPFLFLVKDNRTQCILFLGRLANPRLE
jgi:serpin B